MFEHYLKYCILHFKSLTDISSMVSIALIKAISKEKAILQIISSKDC